MRNVLVTGSSGQLGSRLLDLAPPHWRIAAPDSQALDLRDGAAIRSVVAEAGADVVLNCAAYTDVDGAQADEQTAWQVNADAPAVLAAACSRLGARLVHVSTDYVFDGHASSPYPEDATVSGLGVYGRSKAAGETEVLGAGGTVVRTAWLYAPGPRNFVATMLRLAATGQPLRVVDDQIGQPTYADDLARQIIAMIEGDVPAGVYHGTNSGQTSWFGFAREILRVWGMQAVVEPVTSEEFPRPAPRPSYSVLGHDRWATVGLLPMRPWQDALASAHREHAWEFTRSVS